jgi:hypothetical protein
LFRQEKMLDWEGPIRRVAEVLRGLAGDANGGE